MNVFQLVNSWAEGTNQNIHAFESIESTNDFAKENSKTQSNDFFLVTSDHQSNGRGRGSNTWSSPEKGTALLSTWCYKTNNRIQPTVTPRLGLALAHACNTCWPAGQWSLKAPNDLLLNGKKVGGILVEAVQQGDVQWAHIGLGMNFTSSPKDVPESGHMSEFIDLTEQSLNQFFTELMKNWKSVMSSGHQESLSDSEREELISFLNSNPGLTEKFVSISPNADLETETNSISWKDL